MDYPVVVDDIWIIIAENGSIIASNYFVKWKRRPL